MGHQLCFLSPQPIISLRLQGGHLFKFSILREASLVGVLLGLGSGQYVEELRGLGASKCICRAGPKCPCVRFWCILCFFLRHGVSPLELYKLHIKAYK